MGRKENTWTNTDKFFERVINNIFFEFDSSNKILGYISPKSIGIKMKDNYKITFIRGATTASDNCREIEEAVVELIDELISRNNLIKENLLSITFTSTKDLMLVFPLQ